MSIWNPWHGCRKISPGCQNCYIYQRDESVGRDAGIIMKTGTYDLPRKHNRRGEWKLQQSDGTVFTCMTSDFFLEEADPWRPEAWQMMRERQDLSFTIITNRIHRVHECLPEDWNLSEDWDNFYSNIFIYCTVENQAMADYRIPIYLDLPLSHRCLILEPMLEPLNLEPYLASGGIEYVICGGESGEDARPCNYDWILNIREQCLHHQIGFLFRQTGTRFIMKGKTYTIDPINQASQASKAGINYLPPGKSAEPSSMPFSSIHSLEDHEAWLRTDLFERIAHSNFRSRFRLKDTDRQYVRDKGMDVIRSHAEEFVASRLAPASIPNDGRQTPMRGHPIFLAQHSCGCCCRGCLEKWHGIEAGVELTPAEQSYVVDTLMTWVERQMQ